MTWYVDDYHISVRSLARHSTERDSEVVLPNVILIVADTLARRPLGCYGNERSHMPNIDRLAAEGRMYMKATTACPWTRPLFGSLFTSQYPAQHGADDIGLPLNENLTTLARTKMALSEIAKPLQG